MYISAISPNINCKKYSSNVKKVTSPSFQGEVKNEVLDQVLKMLKEKVTSIKVCSNLEEIKPIVDNLNNKWGSITSNDSIGMMFISEENLANFLGQEASKYDTANNIGLCIAAGDKKGPVETWKKCYEAVTVLLPKSLFMPKNLCFVFSP